MLILHTVQMSNIHTHTHECMQTINERSCVVRPMSVTVSTHAKPCRLPHRAHKRLSIGSCVQWVLCGCHLSIVAQKDAPVPQLLLSTFKRRRKVRSVKVWLETKTQPADYFILGTGPQRPPCILICRSANPPHTHTDPPFLTHANPAFLVSVSTSLFCSLSSQLSFFVSSCAIFNVVSFSQLCNVWLQNQTLVHVGLVKRLGFRPVLFPGWRSV